MTEKITCGEFVYAKDASKLGIRSENWMTLFKLDVEANGYDYVKNDVRIRAYFLLWMAQEAFDIYKLKRKLMMLNNITCKKCAIWRIVAQWGLNFFSHLIKNFINFFQPL